MTLPSGKVEDMALKADNLTCSSHKVMVRDGEGNVRGVAAFASGWLTAHRPGAVVMRFKEEDVKIARAEGVLAGVTDALRDVAAAVESSGLVEVDEAGRLFGMHQLLQKAVRTEVGQAHDNGMAALLEARCGCMGDEYGIDHRMYGVIREVVGVTWHVLGQIKAAAMQRAAWVCNMRVRVLHSAREVIGGQSLEARAYVDALKADLSVLVVEMGRACCGRLSGNAVVAREFQRQRAFLSSLDT